MPDLDSLTLSDLIGVPYLAHGRTLAGLDCYGAAILAVYIISRKHLRDVKYTKNTLELEQEIVPTLNVEKTDKLEPGNLLELTFLNELHIGTVIDSKRFIHATINQGVRISPIGAYKIHSIYRVLNDGNN